MKKLNELLETITAKQANIDSHGKLNNQLAKRIQHKFRLDWNYYSNAMEGNSLTKIETKQLMMDNVTIDGKPFKDIAEMRGHDNEVLAIFKIGKGELRISEKRIKQMHMAIIHEEDPEKKAFIGQWKTSDNYLINYRGEKFNFLPFGEVKDAMHDLLNKTNADIDAVLNNKKDAKHPALIAFEFHLRYLEIHPFYDGNGRTGRLLLNLILISFGYPPVILDDKNRDSYYRLLAEVQGYGLDPKECYAFLAELLIRSQDLVLDAIAGKEIEEDDDIDKEIQLWKQQLTDESQVLKRDNKLLANVYRQSIRPLLELLIERTIQFDDLFAEKRMTIRLESMGQTVSDLDYADRFFDYWEKKPREETNIYGEPESRSEFDNIRNLTQFSFEIYFRGFTKNGVDLFDERVEVSLYFEEFNYIATLRDRHNPIYKKLYSEEISQTEREEFVKNRVKELFEEIKQSVERSKGSK